VLQEACAGELTAAAHASQASHVLVLRAWWCGRVCKAADCTLNPATHHACTGLRG
jgi:hypothetical protein